MTKQSAGRFIFSQIFFASPTEHRASRMECVMRIEFKFSFFENSITLKRSSTRNFKLVEWYTAFQSNLNFALQKF
jgi:hypothetical protein